MQWEFIVALVIAITIILFPAAFIWYLNIGGIYTSIQKAKARRMAREKTAGGERGINKLQFTRNREQ
jgi:hypothetical protein